MYEYRCKILKVVDGDTVDVDIDLGFGVVLSDERVRIMGIDTPESRTSDKVEKVFGIAAKNALKGMLGKTSILKTQINRDGEDMKGKFGRILGELYVNGVSINQKMIDDYHAVEYTGENKDTTTERHMEHRKLLVEKGTVTQEQIDKVS